MAEYNVTIKKGKQRHKIYIFMPSVNDLENHLDKVYKNYELLKLDRKHNGSSQTKRKQKNWWDGPLK